MKTGDKLAAIKNCIRMYLAAGKIRCEDDAKLLSRTINRRTVDFPDDAVIAAIDQWMNTSHWPPTLADIRRLAQEYMTENGICTERGWRDRLRLWAETGYWPATWGPEPTSGRCRAPERLIREITDER